MAYEVDIVDGYRQQIGRKMPFHRLAQYRPSGGGGALALFRVSFTPLRKKNPETETKVRR